MIMWLLLLSSMVTNLITLELWMEERMVYQSHERASNRRELILQEMKEEYEANEKSNIASALERAKQRHDDEFQQARQSWMREKGDLEKAMEQLRLQSQREIREARDEADAARKDRKSVV